MKTQDSKQALTDEQLEALFARAAAVQPELVDDNFTKVVLNSLPRISRTAKPARQLLTDLIGFVIGLVCMFVVVNPAQLVNKISASLPTSVIISSTNILLLAAVMSGVAMFAWWAVERDA